MSIRLASLAVVGLMAGACHVNGKAEDRDPGDRVTRSYQVGAFDKIAVTGPYEVKVVTGGKGAISATGGDRLLDETDVVVEGDTLRIMPKKRNGVRWHWGSGKAEFTVNVAALRAATIAGSGDISVDKLAGDFDGTVSGSGDMRIGQASGGKVSLAINGSGEIDAAGRAEGIDLSIRGSGEIDAAGLSSRTADLSIAGSGSIRANASDSANVSIRGSGDVEVLGGAKCNVSKAGSGDVRCG